MTPREMTDQAQRDGAALERARILGVVATPADAEELATALRATHDGSDRGELRRLLVRLWGPCPSLLTDAERERLRIHREAEDLALMGDPAVSDLRGLAARESAPAHTGIAATWCPICGDCACPYRYGYAFLGRTRDDPNCPLHGTNTTHPCSDFGCDCHGPVTP